MRTIATLVCLVGLCSATSCAAPRQYRDLHNRRYVLDEPVPYLVKDVVALAIRGLTLYYIGEKAHVW